MWILRVGVNYLLVFWCYGDDFKWCGCVIRCVYWVIGGFFIRLKIVFRVGRIIDFVID